MAKQDALYEGPVAEFGPALERLARDYESDPDKRRDLLQEIHVALWRSFESFDNRCSLRTWVYRVHEEFDGEIAFDRNRAIERLLALVQRLPDLDRQIIMLHLEGMDAISIAEIAGLSPANVGTKVHRLKKILIRGVRKGGNDVGKTSL